MRLPGLIGAHASITFSSVSTKATKVSPFGRLEPGGGIISARILRIIFSATSPFSKALSTTKLRRLRLPRRIVGL